jgi:hypothetical protein
MKKLEKILALLFVIAIIFQFNLIVGDSLIMFLSLTTLALIYFPLGFALFNNIPLKKVFKKESYMGLSSLQIISTIFLGIGFSEICIGIESKLLHWGYVKLHLFVGLFFICIALIFYLIHFSESKSSIPKTIVSRMVIFGMLSLFLLNVSDLTLIKIQFRNHPLYIEAFENYLSDRENKDYQIKLDIEYHRATYPKNEFDIYMRFEHPEYKEY